MIVTRRRRKPFPWKRVAIPVGIAALAAAFFAWPPSQHWIAASPIGAPLHFAAQNRAIADRNAQIAALQAAVANAKTQTADRDAQIARLRTELTQAHVRAGQTQVPVRVQKVAPSSTTAPFGDLAQSATLDMRRVAQEWSAMDPEAAARVVQKLPLTYVARILALMTPDAAGAILEDVPPAYAAQLTQDHPELRR